jgi:hypothetical protein
MQEVQMGEMIERGYTEAEGYAASLRQQARWIREHNLEDKLDADELEAAAEYIERAAVASK